MAIPNRVRPGVQDIRTLSGRVDQEAIPYKTYMRLSCLEMEKFRRSQERESALQRIKNIDARFQDIKTEKAALMQTLAALPGKQSVAAQDRSSRPAPRRNTDGVKVRY